MKVRSVTENDKPDWIRMRTALWPEAPGDHPPEIDEFFRRNAKNEATFVAEMSDGSVCGFVEAATRPYAEGCLSSPVGYVEGWWVDPEHRRNGVGAALVAAAEGWARSLGLTEMASDADIANDASKDAHQALGYSEAQHIVCYRKTL